ncbi:Cmi7p Ecym_4487 [Eremothecium cymbalariae DBVPG|uniref:Uncharacterized protein n=1 Tax=Eremothecium cymbalariae (strain CBS 270.75 / DBVPG 7215 / KCTC 17166 / NRRL Y-17582) TaxID=931890 RepID=G8JU23_ERECY|nr:hypothetical protein Ecym_4487 [Eremothecium cymbalariae DBVPG\
MTVASKDGASTSDFLEAFQKLKEGEETAERMERMLDQLEGNIETLLAAAKELNGQDNELLENRQSDYRDDIYYEST